MNDYYVKVANASKSFLNNSNSYSVFENVNFSLTKGEFLCIMGSSGCGKSTLLRCIGGFEPLNSGEIFIDAKRIKNPGTHASMVFQTFDQLFPWKTAVQNILFSLQVVHSKNSVKENMEIAKSYLALVGLEKYASYYPYQLSGGMKQRVAIARSLSINPSVLLMDEPFASLDADTRTVLQKEFLRIWEKSNSTVLFVTHSIIEAITMGTKFLVLGKEDPAKYTILENKVEPVETGYRTPESKGYSDCWSILNKMIR